MNNIFQIIRESIKSILEKFNIEEEIIITISNLDDVDIQINNLVKYKNHISIENIKNEILKSLNKFNYFKNIEFNEIGFLNIVFNLEALSKEIKNAGSEFRSDSPENILIDYNNVIYENFVHHENYNSYDNLNLKQLNLICDYYSLKKNNCTKKEKIINIILFESNEKNFDIFCRSCR